MLKIIINNRFNFNSLLGISFQHSTSWTRSKSPRNTKTIGAEASLNEREHSSIKIRMYMGSRQGFCSKNYHTNCYSIWIATVDVFQLTYLVTFTCCFFTCNVSICSKRKTTAVV